MEENRRFSWSDLFIKVILVIIFILFTVWLLSLSNKKMTNSLDVLTDEIFVKNMERMKEVGKEYFTTERLPEKVGEIEVLTLKKMYEKKFLLELKDKNGNACSAENSYVSIEKFDNEYQMKVFLECGEESDYIIVTMGCYDYCDTDICEKEEIVEDEEYVKGEEQIEYEYKKTTNGKWTDYGSWSEWSKVSVTKTDYRQVETKVVKEEYTYDKTITETEFKELTASCPTGYKKTADGTKCYKEITTIDTKNPVCPSVSGYTLVNQDGFTCNYSKTTIDTKNPTCPSVSGYTLVSQDGFTCNYSKTTTATADPVCPAKDGWNVTRNGFTCNYSRTVSTPYTETVKYSKTCYSSKDIIPCTGCAPVTQRIPYDCSTYGTVTKYNTTIEVDTATASCPSGYSKSGNSCVNTTTNTTTKTASCDAGYSKSGNSCVKSITNTAVKDASCDDGYDKSGNSCVKTDTKITYKSLIKSCPTSYKITSDNTKCYKEVDKVVQKTGYREVTYYRYRVREYVGGTVDYKWSSSKNDTKLLNARYKLTRRTR